MEAIKDYGAFGLALLLAGATFVAPEPARVPLLLVAGLVGSAGFVLRSARTGIGAAAFLAFGCAAYLFSLKLKTSQGPSLCNINDVINCDVINNSAASEVGGVPIALLGMGLYLGLGFASLMSPGATPRFYQFVGLVNIVNLVYSAYLAYEAARIGAVCVMCLTMYASHGLMLWGALRGLKASGEKLLDGLVEMATSNTTLVTGGTFGLVVLVGMSSWSSATARKGTGTIDRPAVEQPGSAPKASAFPPDLLTTPRGPVSLSGTEPVYGNPNAPYQVLEFADYGCPHCAIAAAEVKELVKQFPEIQVRFRPFPLTSQCNPSMQRDMGPERCQAALAAKCAGRQGKFWELNNLIFANQNNLSDGDLAFMAGQVGVDLPQWEACMADPTAHAELRADAEAGAAAGIEGTPSFFLKGTHGDRWIEVSSGAAGVATAVSAHLNGVKLPEPGPPHTH
jgi:protein-disulfide isomerase/uncharacterized membrane protein